jgi:coenzyme F420-0:L-glutamate ligase / coenzyme F420-1:gamma-L-glutamate ligase
MTLSIIPIEGLGEIRPGDDLARLILDVAAPEPGDVVVITQKIVSKAEGRLVRIDASDPRAHKPLVLAEARRILRRRGELIITENRQGVIMANAGIDLSNVPAGQVALWPLDPDASAARLSKAFETAIGGPVGVIVSDTFGRAWRRGLTDVAIGVAGVPALVDLKGTRDALGRELLVTQVAVADEMAAATDLVMGKDRSIPAAIVRGTGLVPGQGRASDLVRDPGDDLFR